MRKPYILPFLRNVAILIAASLSFACHRTADNETANLFKNVESYISDRPDSALVVLQSINNEALSSKKLKARHGLLLSMAFDKNFIDLTSDSLIAPVVEYYEGKTRLGIQPPILNTFSFTRKLSRGAYSVKSGRVLQFPFSIALTPKITSYENNDHTVSEAPFRSGC